MKNILICLIFYLAANIASIKVYAQPLSENAPSAINIPNKILYSSIPNHKELISKTWELAGIIDTVGISYQKIIERLEAGVYSEDFESIPGIIGEHFPNPWEQGPSFNFNDLYPFSKIPYGSYLDNFSGWKRGLYHGYDPVQNFTWPGTDMTTVQWADTIVNNFIWQKTVDYYKGGQKEKAYECLGHLLHLLEDLSIPSHIKIINHGIGISSIKSGLIIDPDVLALIADEYELALAGGLSIPNVYDFIPNLLGNFRSALESSDSSNIPKFYNWKEYFSELAIYTYNQPIVKKNYSAPVQNGLWGSVLNGNGDKVEPNQIGITPPAQIAGRWVQISVKTTADLSGPVFPASDMILLCNDLVPKAVEYGAGLLRYFYQSVITSTRERIPAATIFNLQQNYPNPFNPTTTISYQLKKAGRVTLKIYDVLGNEIDVLVNEEKSAGSYKLTWNAVNLPSGVYFYQLQAGDFISVKKMNLLK